MRITSIGIKYVKFLAEFFPDGFYLHVERMRGCQTKQFRDAEKQGGQSVLGQPEKPFEKLLQRIDPTLHAKEQFKTDIGI